MPSTPPTPRAIKRQRDRAATIELLRVYGDLLTPRQRHCIDGFLAGKTFAEVASEIGVTRQAVHEAVRAVQRLLVWYEQKLALVANPRPTGNGFHNPAVVIRQEIGHLRSLAQFVAGQKAIDSTAWIARELAGIAARLQGQPDPDAASSH